MMQNIDRYWYALVQKYGWDLGDAIIPWLRNPYFWAPVYLFLLVWMWTRYGKTGLWWCVFFLCCFIVADFTSASILKPLFHRLRPCRDPLVSMWFRELVPCGGGFSFPSSHATNHFALSIFISFTLGRRYPGIIFWALSWAVVVAFAQLYVGVHYPSDVLFGALLGSGIGFGLSRLFQFRFGPVFNEMPKHTGQQG